MKSSLLRRGFVVLRSERAVPLYVIVGRLWPASSTFRIADHSRPTGEVTGTSRPQRGPPPTLRDPGRTATTTRPRLRRYSSRRGRGTQLAENRRQIHSTTGDDTELLAFPSGRTGGGDAFAGRHRLLAPQAGRHSQLGGVLQQLDGTREGSARPSQAALAGRGDRQSIQD